MKPTTRLHLQQPYLAQTTAIVTAIHPNGIVLDQTTAFAEGGGQEGDHGWLITDEGHEVPFTDTQKGVGRVLILHDFPTIQVDTPVFHVVADEYRSLFHVGQPVWVKINTERRIRLTVSHSGIHAVLVGLQQVKDDLYPRIRGCHIKVDSARLDFFLNQDDKFSEEQLQVAREYTNALIKANLPAETYAHPHEPEAMYWRVDEIVYPCGGSHLPTLGDIGEVTTSKKSLGASMQRVSFTFPNAVYQLNLFDT